MLDITRLDGPESGMVSTALLIILYIRTEESKQNFDLKLFSLF